ncbi:hypothetical protein HYH02_015105 [Chlamydomonas schloesseri]|uniref:Uncharacterized protein n=1 Tax=Chlamydomonas schloesseri TaxID=2026947 RepID=A0A835VPX4_9CHLO|nr:hypothetical protein HYH02_015105 [Chlamydomonas schloesseri]|eukprot:KAG2424842.1 hypothetical protein HYH02_015105 [Chlamydomonas schloesseri]
MQRCSIARPSVSSSSGRLERGACSPSAPQGHGCFGPVAPRGSSGLLTRGHGAGRRLVTLVAAKASRRKGPGSAPGRGFGASQRKSGAGPDIARVVKRLEEYNMPTVQQMAAERAWEAPECQQATRAHPEYADAFNTLLPLFQETQHDIYGKLVDKIVRSMHAVKHLKVSRVHKAGSRGRGTEVVAASDHDLVVYVRSYRATDMRDPATWRDNPRLVDDMLQEVAAWMNVGLRKAKAKGDRYNNFQVRRRTDADYPHVLKVSTLHHGLVRGHVMDLVLVPDCCGCGCAEGGNPSDWVLATHNHLMGPVFADPPAAAYDMLRERSNTAALTAFVETVPGEVKDVVRLVKGLYRHGLHETNSDEYSRFWAASAFLALSQAFDDEELGGGEVAAVLRRAYEDYTQGKDLIETWFEACLSRTSQERVRSFSLEVLVLAADQQLRRRWEEQGWMSNGQEDGRGYRLALFREALELLVAAVRGGQVVMLDAGPGCGYRREVGMRFGHCWRDHPIRIIHPIDPTCNLERPRDDRTASEWDVMVEFAEAALAVLRESASKFLDLQKLQGSGTTPRQPRGARGRRPARRQEGDRLRKPVRRILD